ncbi:MAG: hypothetical protein M3115_05590 [Thermoproteota archaeon]|nr:hypothetical protein [Thermoproteota archaeon]
MYVILLNRHAVDDIDSHYEYGVFDIDNQRIYRKKCIQYGDSDGCGGTLKNIK